MIKNQRKWGIVLTYLSEAIRIFSALIYTPIMLRLLGQSEYGLYQLVFSVVSYMSLLSFGFAGSYMRFYSRLSVKEDRDGIEKLNGMFMTIFIIISGLCILCGTVMVTNIERIFGEGLTLAEYSKAKILMVLMVLNLALSFPNSVFDAITSARERFIFQKLLIVLQNLLNPFITLPLLIMGYGSVAMVIVTTVLSLLKLIVNAGYCLKKIQVRFQFKNFNISLLKEMWIFTFFIFINMIVDQINWSVDKFLLGRMLGTVAVAVYGVGSQINNLYLQLSTGVSNVFIPKVNHIVAESSDNFELTQLFAKVGRIQFMILALVLSGFVLFGRPFIALWAGREYEDAYEIILLLMIPVTIPLIQNLGIEIQRAKNMHKTRSIVYLFIAISNIFISIPCIMRWGAQGAAIGTAISLFVGNGLFMNWYYQKRIGIDVIFFWKQIAKLSRALVLPGVVGLLLKDYIKVNNIPKLIISILLYIGIYCLSMYFFGMNKEEKGVIVNIKKRLIK